MPERKGASYRIKATRPAHHHDEHTQTTQATAWAKQVGEPKESEMSDSDWLRHMMGKYGPGNT